MEAERAEGDEVGARLQLVRLAGAAQELDELPGGARAHLAHLDLDAVGALEQQLDRGDGLDADVRDVAGLREVGGDAPLGEPRQRELAADEGGHGQADKGERAAQHQRLRLDGGAQQGSGPLSLRALAAVARQPAGVRASRQVTAKRRSAILPHAPRSPARSVRPTVAPVTAGVTVTPSGALETVRA